MHWIDWLIVAVPLVVVTWLGLRTQRYVKGVSDFLTAGRVFSDLLIADWARLKRISECDAVRMRPHPYEVELHLDC